MTTHTLKYFHRMKKRLYDAHILWSEPGEYTNGNHRTSTTVPYIKIGKHLANGETIEIVQWLPYLVLHDVFWDYWTIAISH